MKISFYSLAIAGLLSACAGKSNSAEAEVKAEEVQQEALALVPQEKFNAKAGQAVTDDQVRAWTKSHAAKNPGKHRGSYFSAEVFKKALETKGAAGIRIMLGMNEKGQQVMILVPTDSVGNTIWGNTAFEQGQNCPPVCEDL